MSLSDKKKKINDLCTNWNDRCTLNREDSLRWGRGEGKGGGMFIGIKQALSHSSLAVK